jgi:hypothetical protein
VCRGGDVDIAQQASALGLGDAVVHVDRDPAHQGEVDHDRAVGDRAPGDVVSATADREGRPARRANRIVALTSDVERQRATIAGFRSIIPFQTSRAFSKPGSPGARTTPSKGEGSLVTAESSFM